MSIRSSTTLPALFFLTLACFVLPASVANPLPLPVADDSSILIIPTSTTPTSFPSSQPTMQPSVSIPITKQTRFRQEFTVGNGRAFNNEDIFVFETLYQRYTTVYLPLLPSEAAAKIDTKCAVDKQIFLDSASTGIRNQLIVDYTMKYTSQYYDVTTYPKLFQNWTNSNLNVVLDQMQTLKLNVTQIDSAKRILIETFAPTASFAPSTVPTAFPTTSLDPTLSSSDEPFTTPGNTVIPTIYPTVRVQPEPNRSSFSVIYSSVALLLAGLMLAISLFLYCQKGRRAQAGGFDIKDAKAARGDERRDPEHGESQVDSKAERINSPPPEAFGTLETVNTEATQH